MDLFLTNLHPSYISLFSPIYFSFFFLSPLHFILLNFPTSFVRSFLISRSLPSLSVFTFLYLIRCFLSIFLFFYFLFIQCYIGDHSSFLVFLALHPTLSFPSFILFFFRRNNSRCPPPSLIYLSSALNLSLQIKKDTSGNLCRKE